jgi:hypothetical protein
MVFMPAPQVIYFVHGTRNLGELEEQTTKGYV